MRPIRRVVLGGLGVALFGVVLYQLQLPLHHTGDRHGGTFRDAAEDGMHVSAAPGDQIPGGFEPLAYRLHFDLDPSREAFSGHAEIEVRLAEPSQVIPLHGKRLNVTRARVLTPAGAALTARYREVGPHGDARLMLNKAAPAGVVTLALDYEAFFSDSPEGIYRVTADGVSYLFTHFQAMSARQAFPSFDEPRFRTPFQVSLVVNGADVALSNRPLAVERDIGDGRRLLVFDSTAPLPSHLLAFAVGPFHIRDDAPLPTTPLRGHSVDVRALGLSDDPHGAAAALARTRDLLPALENSLGVPYPYFKLDLIFVPGLAAPAAYPGIIFYSADALPMPSMPQHTIRQQVDEQHVYALAQQWFGNLVTPAGWDQGWLGPALAKWLSARTLQSMQPDLDAHLGFGRTWPHARGAMMADMSHKALSLRHAGAMPAAGHMPLDTFAYDKGAAVLAMFEGMVGVGKFRTIARHYVQTNTHRAATVGDFLKSVTEVLGEDVTAAALRTFVDQPGVPLVTVDWNCAQQGVSIAVTQERYAPLGQAVRAPAETPAVWGIPLCLRMPSAGGDDITQCMLAARPAQTFYLRQHACPHAIIPNADGRGYYYWLVSGPNAARLSDMVPRLSAPEVLSYADSLSAAFQAGRLMVPEYLAAIRSLASSPQWEAVVRPLDDLRFLLHDAVPQNPAARRAAQAVLADLYRPRLELGLQQGGGPNDHSAGAREVRRRLLDFYVRDLEDPGLIAMLAEHGRRILGHGETSAGPGDDMPELTVSAALMTEGPARVEAIKRQLAEITDASKRQAILWGWALAPRLDVTAAFLHYLTDAETPVGDIEQGLALIAHNPSARPLLWMWLTEHGLALTARLPDWRKGDVVDLVGTYCDHARADMAAQSFAPLAEESGATDRLQRAIEDIRQCAALKDAVADSIRQAFKLPPPAKDVAAPLPVQVPAQDDAVTQIPD